MIRDPQSVPVGEVVDSSSTSFVAQCPRQERASLAFFPAPPALGSFVYVSQPPSTSSPIDVESDTETDPFVDMSRHTNLIPDTTYGLVSFARTVSTDQTRRPMALGIGSEDELRRAQPQIFELMTVEFSVVLSSTTDASGKISHRLPARPPRLHAFVYECEGSAIVALTEDFGFLRSIFANLPLGSASADEIASATLRLAWIARACDDGYLIRAGKAVLPLVQGDYDRFQGIIDRLR